MLAVVLRKGPVVAERRNREAGENLLVDGPLDQAGLFPASLGDHRAASPTGALEAIHFVLLPADLQRGDPQRLTFRMQQTPGLNGRVAREARAPIGDGGLCSRNLSHGGGAWAARCGPPRFKEDRRLPT